MSRSLNGLALAAVLTSLALPAAAVAKGGGGGGGGGGTATPPPARRPPPPPPAAAVAKGGGGGGGGGGPATPPPSSAPCVTSVPLNSGQIDKPASKKPISLDFKLTNCGRSTVSTATTLVGTS